MADLVASLSVLSFATGSTDLESLSGYMDAANALTGPCRHLFPVAWTAATRFCAASSTALCSECFRQADHITDRSAWTHHTRSVGITLTVGLTPCRVRAGYTEVPRYTTLHRGICQTMSVGVGRRSSSPLIGCTVVCRTTDQDSAGWLVVWCRRSAGRQQVASFLESDRAL